MNGNKKFYLSKTFWFSVLTVLVSAAGVFGFADFAPGADTLAIAGVVVGVVNLILRFISNQGLEF